jgi:hypothetical protein
VAQECAVKEGGDEPRLIARSGARGGISRFRRPIKVLRRVEVADAERGVAPSRVAGARIGVVVDRRVLNICRREEKAPYLLSARADPACYESRSCEEVMRSESLVRKILPAFRDCLSVRLRFSHRSSPMMLVPIS